MLRLKIKNGGEKMHTLMGLNMIPQKLLCDPNIPHTPKVLWGVYYAFAQKKEQQDNIPLLFVSESRISKCMNRCGVGCVRTWTHYLHKEGWLTVTRTGRELSITLHNRKRRR